MTKKSAIIVWVSILLLCFYYTFTHLNFETNILKLLPKYDSNITSSLIEKASSNINDKLIIVISSTSQAKAKANFLDKVSELNSSNLFKQVKSEIQLDQYQQLYQKLLPYKHLMMAKTDQLAMDKYQEFDYFIDMATAQLYGLTAVNQNQINNDPLFFFFNIINQLSEFNNLNIQTDGNLFHVFKHNKHHYFAFVQLQQSAFSPDYQQRVTTFIEHTRESLKSGVEFFAFGSILYAQHAYTQAKGEVSTVGVGSLVGILLLFIMVFRSVTPLFISVTSIGLGLVFAFAITVFVFGKVHLFALVFGSTIAGVSIDYCFHYLCESTLNKNKQTIIKQILPGLIIGFSSSAMVYLGFILTGYQVLAQISLFSICGLMAVLLNVIIFFPAIINLNKINKSHFLFKLAKIILNNPLAKIFNSLSKLVIFFLLILLLNWFGLNPNDDVRALQSLSGTLKLEEKYIKDVLSLKTDGQYVLVHAKTIDELLNIESKLINQLRKQNDAIIGVSDFIPATNQQHKYKVFYEKLYASDSFEKYIINNGLDKKIITTQSKQFNKNYEIQAIDYKLFQSTSIQNILSQRWLGKVNGVYALAIPLFNGAIIDTSEQVVVVQQAEDASKLFAEFRKKSMKIVMLSALVLILLLASLRYGLKKAIHIVLLPFFAGLSSLLLTQLFGFHISLFSILALLLILGMGLDYVVFLTESHNPPHVAFALILSSITTILSFGLLSLSQVAVIKSFGFTVALGILLILLISPAIIKQGKTRGNP